MILRQALKDLCSPNAAIRESAEEYFLSEMFLWHSRRAGFPEKVACDVFNEYRELSWVQKRAALNDMLSALK